MYSVTPTGYWLLFGCYLGNFKVVLAQTDSSWGQLGTHWFAHDQLKIRSRLAEGTLTIGVCGSVDTGRSCGTRAQRMLL